MKYDFLYNEKGMPGVIDDSPVMDWMLDYGEEELKAIINSMNTIEFIDELKMIFEKPPYSFRLLPLIYSNFDSKTKGSVVLMNKFLRNDIIKIETTISNNYQIKNIAIVFDNDFYEWRYNEI